MPRPLTNAEMNVLQQDTDYLSAGIPVWGSRLVLWNDKAVLIYHTQYLGYFTTDITDLGQSRIAELANESEVHGFWYYLPQEIQGVIQERAEQVISAGVEIGKSVEEVGLDLSQALGQILQNILAPIILPIIIIGAIALIYFLKKG